MRRPMTGYEYGTGGEPPGCLGALVWFALIVLLIYIMA